MPAYRFNVIPVPTQSLVRLTVLAADGKGAGKGMAYSMSAADAAALAVWLLAAANPVTRPAMAQSGMEVFEQPPTPPPVVPVDPAFAALEAARANMAAERARAEAIAAAQAAAAATGGGSTTTPDGRKG